MEAMTKRFSSEDRDEVRRRIMEEGRALFARHGVRKTTMDDIAKAASIGKGTVYLFFPSKDDLVFELIREEYKAYGMLIGRLERTPKIDRADIQEALRELFEMLGKSPLLHTLHDTGESEEISRVLSKEKLTEHEQDEACFLRELFDVLRRKGFQPRHGPEVVQGLFHVVWLAIMNKERTYGDNPVVDELMIDMLCRELTGESEEMR